MKHSEVTKGFSTLTLAAFVSFYPQSGKKDELVYKRRKGGIESQIENGRFRAGKVDRTNGALFAKNFELKGDKRAGRQSGIVE